MMGTPVETIVPLTKAFLTEDSNAGCIISDVGSVKGEIVRGMERLLPKNISFRRRPSDRRQRAVGRASGAAAICSSHHRCILTPTRKTDRQALEKIAALWRKVGADVEIMDPDVARPCARRDQPSAPCIGVRVGQRPGAQAAEAASISKNIAPAASKILPASLRAGRSCGAIFV